jgi:hypothetical protein
VIAVGPARVREGVSWEDPFFSDVLDGRNSQLGYVVQRARGSEPLHVPTMPGALRLPVSGADRRRQAEAAG